MTFKYGDQVLCERGKILKLARNADLQIVQSEAMLEGYQIYLVEQWVCNRNRPYKTVKVFTGDPSHRIRVCVVRITEENVRNASPELKDLLKEMEDDMASRTKPVRSMVLAICFSRFLFLLMCHTWYHSDQTFRILLLQTEIGNIMVTDPSNFSSNLDMVLVPGGDYEEHIQSFYVNINLRRTQCAGRSALNLSRPRCVRFSWSRLFVCIARLILSKTHNLTSFFPSDAQQDKFKSLFKIADSMPFGKAVLELVRLAQASLHIFGLLPAEYIDGLLCNMTGMALETFYMEFGPFPGVERYYLDILRHSLSHIFLACLNIYSVLFLGDVVTRGVARASSARLASEQGRQLQD
ncbi:hypothetical protein BC937DRAFT_94695 [Endogone sp. FLAS-F59071]|nr:hypothetical protein BC937DRAFT_94695 [Endogone sp. FLAS-F59071]|eukprot:RUS20656.1 hypothetical protein BC937DRAFT_94695 [Endogone sp. FLAS-F59071]